MKFSPALEALIEALACLPGVGRKTAQRMAFHLLERDRDGARELAESVAAAMESIGHCDSCRMFTEKPLCEICASERRDASLLCVVEGPADVAAIEQGAGYQGRYFVLMGHLSPLDGIGPADIGLDALRERLSAEPVDELIIATNSTVEGEATAHFLAELARSLGIRCSRIAHGVPMGGELEYVDGGTLSQAITARRPV